LRRAGLLLILLLTLGAAPVKAGRAQTLQTLTYADNGSTVNASVGDTIELQLSPQMNWDVSVSDGTVLAASPGPLPADVQGSWQAASAGQSSISANGRPVCNPGEACAQFIIHFGATVDVSVGGSTSGGTSINYPAGWNLVAGPTGTVFPVGLYDWNATQGGYQQLPPNTPVQAGQGYWALFAQPTTVALRSAGQDAVSIPLAAGRWAQVGNPSATAGARVSGADAVYTYDAARESYEPSSLLAPGQGAWVYSAAGGAAVIAAGP